MPKPTNHELAVTDLAKLLATLLRHKQAAEARERGTAKPTTDPSSQKPRSGCRSPGRKQ